MKDDSLSHVTTGGLAFDLVVATLGRSTELDAFLASLENQTGASIRLLVVDQNEDTRVAETLENMRKQDGRERDGERDGAHQH